MAVRPAQKPHVRGTSEGRETPGIPASRERRRAEELPGLFPPVGGSTLPRPVLVLATGGPREAVARCRHTVKPLTTALRTRLRGELALGTEKTLACAALAAPMPVLGCWHHAAIPPT
ncbi:hypothetical protein [Streptomyces sp. TLI_146]|uniref:hypothetical protein n=1 Tax=Streptomyces sp. TLI_146 TaxID=1938858 RepID=UPI000C702D61|nr:hypothetical protein [Streptomyces sp. TLI_146]PKV83059.1 hypothetical protein BX283_0549 [Streptomyces sp. TLI_146]